MGAVRPPDGSHCDGAGRKDDRMESKHDFLSVARASVPDNPVKNSL